MGPPIPGAPWAGGVIEFLAPPLGGVAPVAPAAPSAGHRLPFLARDPTADQRTRRFSEQVSQILNSLYMRGRLVQLGPTDWDVTGTDDGSGLTGTFNTGTFGS